MRFDATATCSDCKVEQPLSEFWLNRRRPNGRNSRCKECQKRHNDQPHQRRSRQSATLKNKYGITLDEYDEMLAAQGGGCAICKTRPGRRRLHVDHNHETGHVRGLLCHACNVGIGLMREDPSLFDKAVTYLEKYRREV